MSGMSEREIIARQAEQLAEQAEQIAAQARTIEELQSIIKELQRRLGENSQNSSKPPSSDGYRKPKPKSQRKKTGKKQGGQEGHLGSHMEIPHEPDEIKQHLPENCQTCPHLGKCLVDGKVFHCGEKRYVVEAEVRTKVTEHQSIRVSSCPCGKTVPAGTFPENVKAYVQYGDSVTVLAGLLNTYGAVSNNRIHVLLGSLLGVRLSTGTVLGMVEKCAKKIGKTMGEIKGYLIKSPVVNFDETGIRVGGKLLWAHNSSTADLTYQTVQEKRGQEGMESFLTFPGRQFTTAGHPIGNMRR